MLKLPGLIDPHVHLRTPGQEYKEDFYTGTSAALAGGYTSIIDMPNNIVPITTLKLLSEKISVARKSIVCDVGFYFGSLGNNFDQFKKAQDKVMGIKIFLNQTTGNFIVDEKIFGKIYDAWPKNQLILVHAEDEILDKVLKIARNKKQKIHVCHVSSAKELQIIINAKMKGYLVTCGVTPHHLFLDSSHEKKLKSFAKMKPSLKSKDDVAFLWQHLKDIDVIESDHAPHTFEEKMKSAAINGVPGLETTLALLLTAVHRNMLTIADIVRLCYKNPKDIFFFRRPELISKSEIEVEEDEEWTVKNGELFTKCNWSPFSGWGLKGKVKRVILRGKKVFDNGKILVSPGFGKII